MLAQIVVVVIVLVIVFVWVVPTLQRRSDAALEAYREIVRMQNEKTLTEHTLKVASADARAIADVLAVLSERLKPFAGTPVSATAEYVTALQAVQNARDAAELLAAQSAQSAAADQQTARDLAELRQILQGVYGSRLAVVDAAAAPATTVADAAAAVAATDAAAATVDVAAAATTATATVTPADANSQRFADTSFANYVAAIAATERYLASSDLLQASLARDAAASAQQAADLQALTQSANALAKVMNVSLTMPATFDADALAAAISKIPAAANAATLRSATALEVAKRAENRAATMTKIRNALAAYTPVRYKQVDNATLVQWLLQLPTATSADYKTGGCIDTQPVFKYTNSSGKVFTNVYLACGATEAPSKTACDAAALKYAKSANLSEPLYYAYSNGKNTNTPYMCVGTTQTLAGGVPNMWINSGYANSDSSVIVPNPQYTSGDYVKWKSLYPDYVE